MRDRCHYAPEPPPDALPPPLQVLLSGLWSMLLKVLLLCRQGALSVTPNPGVLSSVLVCFVAVSLGMLSSRPIVAMTLR